MESRIDLACESERPRGSARRAIALLMSSRRAWFAAGLETATRGATRARRPGDVHYWRASLLLSKAETDPELAEGGAEQLVRDARQALLDAHEAGHPLAAELASYLEVDASAID